MSAMYSEVDRLVLERWDDVRALIEAQRRVQDRIEQVIGIVKERLARWAEPQGYLVDARARDSEIHAWPTAWDDKRKGPRAQLVIGGFCPNGFRKLDVPGPYLWLHTGTLENFKVKEPQRKSLAQALRAALGPDAPNWDAHGVDDDGPLGRYLTGLDNSARAELVSSPDALFEFCTAHFPTLFALVPTVQPELDKFAR
jgi:hypothetical protein